ncbi:MAG TPA: signal peptidase I [Candidatus Saccharimonadales bacterium]
MTEYYPPQVQSGETPRLSDTLPPNPAPQPEPKEEKLSGMGSTIAVLLLAPLVALFLTAFVFQSYQVDGPSMETTLQNNDRLLVWKLPRTWARITKHDYIPKRGDVVIFVERDSTGLGQGSGKQLIKRVVALPGERVVINNGILTVYNKENPKGFQPDRTLPYGNVIPETSGKRDVTVPKGSLYVVGDNRNNSLDSRSFGPIEAHDLVGKLVLRVWPLGNAKKF